MRQPRDYIHFISTSVSKLLIIWMLGSTVGADGEESTKSRWEFRVGDGNELTSPAIGPDHTVYLGVRINTDPNSGQLLAIRPDGREKWAVPFTTTEEIVESSPVLSPDAATVYIGCTDGRLYAIDSTNGRKKWDFDTGHTNHAIYASPAVAADGTVYIGATDTGTEIDSVFFAVSPITHEPLWRVSSSGSIECSPAIAADGTIYFAGGTDLYAVTREGEVKWIFPFKGPMYASPAIGPDGTIYVGSDAAEFVAITPLGKERWRQQFTPGAGASVGPDGTIYVGSIEPAGFGKPTGKLYAISPDGVLKRTPPTFSAPIVTIPAVRADGAIIFGCNDKTVRAYNIDGTQRWSVGVSDPVNSSPVIDTDGSIYVGAGQRLYALPGSGASLSEYASWPMYNRDIAHRSQAAEPVRGGVLRNLATRGFTGPGNPLIAGFVLAGTPPETLLVRAVGPTLGRFISNPLSDPVLTIQVLSANSTQPFFYQGNDDWGTNAYPVSIEAAAAQAGAFPLIVGSKDSVVLAQFAPPLNYTGVIESGDNRSGIALAELYDMDLSSSGSQLMNVSTRGFVGSGDNVLIAGLVIAGPGRLRVLVRGVGPGLRQFGVPDALQRPILRLFNEASQPVLADAAGTGDLAAAARLVGAFALADDSSDSAMIFSLNSGAYTVQLAGTGTETGVGLVEVYALPY